MLKYLCAVQVFPSNIIIYINAPSPLLNMSCGLDRFASRESYQCSVAIDPPPVSEEEHVLLPAPCSSRAVTERSLSSRRPDS